MFGWVKRIGALLCSFVMGLAGHAPAATVEARYSSFDGGGPEYDLRLDREGVVSWDCWREYDDPDHEDLCGAGYDMVFRFTGEAPGRVKATVTGESPITDAEEDTFWLTVDSDLNVSLRRARPISSFFLSRGGYIVPVSYTVRLDDGKASFQVDDKEPTAIDAALMDELADLVARNGMADWDGFSGSDPNVLDGEGFTLRVEFADGGKVYASGENHFPRGYWQAVSELTELFGAYLPEW